MANYKIRQEINFINRIISADSSAIVAMDASDYNGATFYFEVVAKVDSGTLTVGCWDVALGSNKTTVSVTATSYTIYRSASFTPTAGARTYIVDVSGGTAPLIKSARIVILQDAAAITATQTQIEMGDYETNTATPAEDPVLFPISEPKYWKYESAKWDPTPTFSFGYTAVCETDMGDVTIGLEADDGSFNWTGSFVTGSQNLFANETIAYYENGPITLTDGLHYRVAVMVENDAYGFDLFNAKIIATQTDATLITKLQPEYLMINEAQTGTGNQENLTDYDPAEWNVEGGSLKFYHEHSASSASSNTKLQDEDTTDLIPSSITGANLVRSSFLYHIDTDDQGGLYYGVWGDGTYIYTASDTSGLMAYSFNGTTLTHIDTDDQGGNYQGVWGDGTYIYTASGGSGLMAYSFNGTTLTHIDTDYQGGNYGVWGDGTYIYTACGVSGLIAYSFNGTTLTYIDTDDQGGNYRGVWGDGTYIYTVCDTSGLMAYSFNGTTLTHIDTDDQGGSYYGVWGDGTYIYTASDTSGLMAYSFNGTTLTHIDTDYQSGNYYGVWSDGTYIYTASYTSGLMAYGTTPSITMPATAKDIDSVIVTA